MAKEFNPLELKMLQRLQRNAIDIIYDLYLWHYQEQYTFYQYLRIVNYQLENVHEQENKNQREMV